MYCLDENKKVYTCIDVISFPLYVFKLQLVVSTDVELKDVKSTEYAFSFLT